MPLDGEWSGICRVCMKTKQQFESLFAVRSGTYISELLMSFANVKVRKGDGLPKVICIACVEQLETCFALKHIAEESDVKLRKIFSAAEVETVDQDGMKVIKKIKSIRKVRALKQADGSNVLVPDDDADGGDRNMAAGGADELPDVGVKTYHVYPTRPVTLTSPGPTLFETINGKNHTGGVKRLPDYERPQVDAVDEPNEFDELEDIETEDNDNGYDPVEMLEVSFSDEEVEDPLPIKKLVNQPIITLEDILSKRQSPHTPRSVAENYEIEGKIIHKKTISSRTRKPVGKTKVLDDPLQCLGCRGTFDTRELAQEHREMCRLNIQKSCHLCGYDYANSRDRVSHYRNEHPSLPMYSCLLCGREGTSLRRYKDHMDTHLSKRRLYPCEICGQVCLTRDSRIVHGKLKHTVSETTFECDLCSKAFRNKRYLQDHLKNHTNTSEFKCEFCFRVFKSKSNLKTHKTLHTGQLPFGCDFCDSRFRTKVQMQRHVLKAHSNADVLEHGSKVLPGPNPLDSTLINFNNFDHECLLCGDKFLSMSDLKDHLMEHV